MFLLSEHALVPDVVGFYWISLVEFGFLWMGKTKLYLSPSSLISCIDPVPLPALAALPSQPAVLVRNMLQTLLLENNTNYQNVVQCIIISATCPLRYG